MNDEEKLNGLKSYKLIIIKKRLQMSWQIVSMLIGLVNFAMLLRLTFEIDWAALGVLIVFGMGVLQLFGKWYEKYLWPRENQYDVSRVAPYSKEVVMNTRDLKDRMKTIEQMIEQMAQNSETAQKEE